MNDLKTNSTAWSIIFICWIISSIATGGSLFFSEVIGFPPCTLCWYQRIAMYPLVLIFLMGIIKLDQAILRYSIPLVITGWLTAIYHNLLHYKIIPESASPCREGVSCSDVWIKWFGFITIPVLSFFAFSLLLILLIIFYKKFLSNKDA